MVNYQYDSSYGRINRDKPRGAFGKPASQCRIDISNEVNDLGDMLRYIGIKSVMISVRGTVSMGTTFRLDKIYSWTDEDKYRINIILFRMNYEVAKEDKKFIYLKRGVFC